MFSFKKRNLDKLKKFIRKSDNKLSNEDREGIIQLIRPSIGISTKKLSSDNLKIGKSKIGGKPDMPENIDWPTLNNSPLIFCAQYNVAEMKKYDTENLLPKEGMFYIFLGINEEWNGFSIDENVSKIFFIENLENLERKEYPESLNEDNKIDPAEIVYFERLTLPDDENYKLLYFNEKYEDFYFYFYQETDEFLTENLYEPFDSMHQILGEDRSIQSSVVYDFAKNELNIKNDEEHVEKWNDIFEYSKSYKLLIQLDCMDSNTNLNKFGGTGVFYIGLKEEELKKMKFDNLRISYQST